MRALLLVPAVIGCIAAPAVRADETYGHVSPIAPTTLAERPPASSAQSLAKPSPAKATDAAFHMAPLTTYSEVVRRPLFSPDRRPHAAAQAAALPQSFELRGIVILPAAPYAIVQEGSTTKRVAEGEALGGGTVKQILRDRVVLDVKGVETPVKLYDPNAKNEPTPRHSSAGGIPSQVPPGFPPAAALRPH